MQAVILAGGLGTRLGNITKSIPKPMVPIAGRPYLEYQLEFLRQQGLTDILLLVGYLGEQIEDYFGDGSRFGLTIRYCQEATPQGTGGALRDAGSLLADRFLLLYGDSFLPVNYAAVICELDRDAAAVGVAVVYDNRESTTVPNNIAIDEAGYVVRYAKDAEQTPDLRYVEAGVQSFRRSILDYLPAGQPVSLEKEAFPRLIAEHKLLAFPTQERFYDIGTPERLAKIEQVFSTR